MSAGDASGHLPLSQISNCRSATIWSYIIRCRCSQPLPCPQLPTSPCSQLSTTPQKDLRNTTIIWVAIKHSKYPSHLLPAKAPYLPASHHSGALNATPPTNYASQASPHSLSPPLMLPHIRPAGKQHSNNALCLTCRRGSRGVGGRLSGRRAVGGSMACWPCPEPWET